MTPDITDEAGNRIRLSMRDLAALPDVLDTGAWQKLTNVATEYKDWMIEGEQK